MKRFSKTNLENRPDRLNIVFINGTVLRVHPIDAIRWTREPTTALLYGLAVGVFLIYVRYIGPEDFLPTEVWQVAVTVLVVVVVFFVVLLCLLCLSFGFAKLQPNFILPLSVVIVITHVLSQFIGVLFIEIWGIYTPASALLYLRILNIYFVVVGLEIVYTVYILPHSQLYRDRLYTSLTEKEGTSTSTPDASPEGNTMELHAPATAATDHLEDTSALDPPDEQKEVVTIQLGDHVFDVPSIRMVHAEQNYVSITTTFDTILVRARMKDITDSLSGKYGIKAHRSCWISFEMIAGSKSLSNGKLAFDLTDGSTVTVPRARRKQVLALLQRANKHELLPVKDPT